MTFPELRGGVPFAVSGGGSGPLLFRRGWMLGFFPQGAAQDAFSCWGEGTNHHTHFYLSGQLRRWRYLDRPSKTVFFKTKWFPSPSADHLGSSHNSWLFTLAVETKLQ